MPEDAVKPEAPAEIVGAMRTLTVNYDDIDCLGVVHNSRFALLVERAIAEFWAEHGFTIVDGRATMPDMSTMVKDFAITYHRPLRSLGPVKVQFWIRHMDSVKRTYVFRILSDDLACTYADGTRTTVSVDPQTGNPVRMSAAGRRIARSIYAPEAAQREAGK